MLFFFSLLVAMAMRCRRIPVTLWLMMLVVVVSFSFIFTFRRLLMTTTTLLQDNEDESLVKSRLLCFVLVDARNVDAAVAVKETWGQRGCDTLLFFRFV